MFTHVLPRRPLVAALAAVTAFSGGLAVAPQADAFLPKKPYRLTLLHANDLESKLLTGDSTANFGGAARFQTVLERLRAAERSSTDSAIRSGAKRRGSVLISSGDNFLAGLNRSASFKKGIPWYESIAFARHRYDAATIGNHEFDFGPDRLHDFIAGAGSAPFLSANLDVWPEPKLRKQLLQGKIRLSTIISRGGDLIGVIGLTTPDISNVSSPGKVRIQRNLASVVNRESGLLRSLGINKIILSSHLQGIPMERAIIPQIRGVDVVIAGGGDELLANPGDLLTPDAPAPVGPYPIKVADADGNVVPVVTTPGELRYVGRLTMEFDRNGKLTSIDTATSGLVRVSGRPTDPDYAAPDPYLVEHVDKPLLEYRAALDANVLATSEVGLDGRNPVPVRSQETNMGNLVADAYLYAARRRAATTPGAPTADIAIANGGGIRNGTILPAGPITEGDTFEILPFDNIVVTVPNIGRTQLKELLENGYMLPPTGAGRFAHIAGLKVKVDRSRTAQVTASDGTITTPGERVREATLTDGTPLIVDGAVVPGPAVNVATVDFLAKGGDFYPYRGAPFVSTTTPYQEALRNFLTDTPANGGLGGAVTAARYPQGGDGRITFLG